MPIADVPSENGTLCLTEERLCSVGWEPSFSIPTRDQQRSVEDSVHSIGMEIASVELYFHEVLTSALRSENVKVKDATEYYLVHLLCNYTRAQLDPEPLALKLIHAAEALPADRIRLLQEVGDTALTTSGLFGESLSRRTIRVNYYVDLGRAAYAQLAATPKLLSAILRDACSELAERFPRLVDVLLCLRSRINLAVPSDLIELYERWHATGNRVLEQRLRQSGVLIPRIKASH